MNEPAPIPPLPAARPPSRVQTPAVEAPLWPAMLRAAGLGLRPGRVFIMFMAVTVVSLLARMPMDLWVEAKPLARSIEEAADAGWSGWGPFGTLWALVGGVMRASPWTLGLVVLPGSLALISAAGAVSRMAAVEFAWGRTMSYREGLAFSGRRWVTLAAAHASPVMLAGAVWLAISGIGAALLWIPGFDVVGGVVHVLFVIAGLFVGLLAAAMLAGGWMIAPAAVCESVGDGEGHGDAVDALQRALAYTLNAPARLALYGGIGLAQVWAVWLAGSWIARFAVAFAHGAATAWLPEDRLREGYPDGAGASLMILAEAVPRLIAAGAAASVAVSAATMMYLLLRRVCDGQDERDLAGPAAPTPADDGAAADGAHEE